MNARLTAKLAPWSAVVFVVLMVGWFITTPGDFLDDPDSLASDYADDLGMFLGGAQMAAIAAAALLWFSGTIASALIANGAGERLAGMARSGGTAAAALLMSGVAIIAVGALIADEQGEIAAESASLLFNVGVALVFGAMPLAVAVLVAATGSARSAGTASSLTGWTGRPWFWRLRC